MAGSESAALELRVLGPVQAVRDGHALPIGGPRQRALLALLVLERGRPVSVDTLAEEIWHGSPPEAAPSTIPTYVSRLRKALGDGVRIPATAGGYLLDIPADRVDLLRFERLVAEGGEARARGADRRAAARLREALELWRGRPFAELASEGALAHEAERLDELRLLALEGRIEAELRLGAAAELVDELEALVAEHPYRERFWGQLMLVLYRSQRQADALAAYRRARAVLVGELGLEPGEELRALEQAILRHDVPVVSPAEQRHNLPAPLTSFVGRAAELDELEQLLESSRLVTLTGVGGVGKTRLAQALGWRLLAQVSDGVFLCDLAPLADPELVATSAASALGLREHRAGDVAEQLVERLREEDVVLVLDNCEHVRDSCASLAQQLLTACPRLRIVATSRLALGLAGEVDYPVPPLRLPVSDAGADEARAAEAVELFLARAREARPGLAEDAHAVETASRICRDVDGLPLAIELAAARAKSLSLDDIAARLGDRFRFLVSWRRLAAARHRTLREAMDWSYALLSEEEQALLARLSVFAGGFSLATAADVCLRADEERALDLLGHLVDASLVVAEERAGAMRYRLLETVRQYAAARLDERGEAEPMRRRHAEHVVAFLERGYPRLHTELDSWVASMEPERDNVRAALAWSEAAHEQQVLAAIVSRYWFFWWIRGELSEGRRWLDSALAADEGFDPLLRAHVLEGAAGLAWAQGDVTSADTHAGEALPLFSEARDRRGEYAALTILGHVAFARGRLEDAEERFRRCALLAPEAPRPGAYEALALHNVGSCAFERADLATAGALYERSLVLYREEDDRYGIALCELFLGLVAVDDGRLDEAVVALRSALEVFLGMGFLQYTALCLEGCGSLARARGRREEAARLFGAADAVRAKTGAPPLKRVREGALAALRSELGEAGFAAAWGEGHALALDASFELAQSALAG